MDDPQHRVANKSPQTYHFWQKFVSLWKRQGAYSVEARSGFLSSNKIIYIVGWHGAYGPCSS